MSILGLLLLTLIPTAFPLSFNMSPITKSDGDRLNLTGDSYITDEGIQVTTNERDQNSLNRTGRATYTEALHLWNNASQKLADFTTHFSFVIDSSGSYNFGDGLAFFLAPQGSSIEPWTFGGGLGLGNATAGSSPFVAVEFDTFPNPVLDPPYDGNRVVPHVGIDLNNLSSVMTATWHNNVTAGWQNDAYIRYDSVTKLLSVDFSGTSNNVSRLESLSYEVDLRDYLPEYVIVGFSAATGASFEKHNVKSWNFSSTDVGSDQEPSPSPEPKLSVLIKSQAQVVGIYQEPSPSPSLELPSLEPLEPPSPSQEPPSLEPLEPLSSEPPSPSPSPEPPSLEPLEPPSLEPSEPLSSEPPSPSPSPSPEPPEPPSPEPPSPSPSPSPSPEPPSPSPSPEPPEPPSPEPPSPSPSPSPEPPEPPSPEPPSPSPSPSPKPPSLEPQVVKDPMPMSKKNKKKRLILGLSSGISVFILVLASTYTFCFLLPKKKKEADAEEGEVHLSDIAMDKEFEKGKRPIKFSYKELVLATNNFAKDRKLGEGGFGSVYRGHLTSTNTNVAVKKVSEGSKQGRKEYASEVKIISQLRHINLVELIGWCHQGFELLLVYELMPNGSLDSHLFKPNSVLTWEIRHKVARGLASALLYLHEELAQYVVHRDIKASNIMLDSSFNAKLGDFGLARLVDHDKVQYSTNPAGTIGYMAPEYLATGRASKETDVYSFGVVLLEIACGRMSVGNEFCKNQVRLVEWVWSLYGSGQLRDAADPKLDSSEYDERKLERLVVVGLWCVHPESSRRPSIREVLQVLNSEAPLPSLPLAMPKPVYYYNNASREATTSSSSTTYSGGGASSSAGTTSDLVSQTDPTPVFQQPQPFNAAAAPSPKKRRRATSCEQCD